jgi:hypothetical protein
MSNVPHEEHDRLIKQLENESSELVPMLRSKIYPQIIASGNSIVPLLISSVRDTTVKHYLTLMAIAEMDRKALLKIPVETRLRIYSDALQKDGPNNDWGLAGEYLSGASLDLLGIGEKAIPTLIPFLDDTRAAGMWGSEEATVNKQHGNRVCDFAYYLILQILKRDEQYSESPEKRDTAIGALKKFLEK